MSTLLSQSGRAIYFLRTFFSCLDQLDNIPHELLVDITLNSPNNVPLFRQKACLLLGATAYNIHHAVLAGHAQLLPGPQLEVTGVLRHHEGQRPAQLQLRGAEQGQVGVVLDSDVLAGEGDVLVRPEIFLLPSEPLLTEAHHRPRAQEALPALLQGGGHRQQDELLLEDLPQLDEGPRQGVGRRYGEVLDRRLRLGQLAVIVPELRQEDLVLGRGGDQADDLGLVGPVLGRAEHLVKEPGGGGGQVLELVAGAGRTLGHQQHLWGGLPHHLLLGVSVLLLRSVVRGQFFLWPLVIVVFLHIFIISYRSLLFPLDRRLTDVAQTNFSFLALPRVCYCFGLHFPY